MKRYTFQGVLELEGALHIGSGGGGGGVDATVVRDSSGQPYIPGSSLRGTLRAAIGQYGPMLGLSEIREDDEIKQAVELFLAPGSLNSTAESAIQTQLDAILTPAERLFGTVWWSSPLLIPDLYPRRKQPAFGDVRDSVGIDRDTGAARDGAKYDFEVLPRGESFTMRMTLDVSTPAEKFDDEWKRLLALGFRLLELAELPLGGRLARGVGQVRLSTLDVYVLDAGDKKALLAALLASDANARMGVREAAGWTTRQMADPVGKAA